MNNWLLLPCTVAFAVASTFTPASDVTKAGWDVAAAVMFAAYFITQAMEKRK